MDLAVLCPSCRPGLPTAKSRRPRRASCRARARGRGLGRRAGRALPRSGEWPPAPSCCRPALPASVIVSAGPATQPTRQPILAVLRRQRGNEVVSALMRRSCSRRSASKAGRPTRGTFTGRAGKSSLPGPSWLREFEGRGRCDHVRIKPARHGSTARWRDPTASTPRVLPAPRRPSHRRRQPLLREPARVGDYYNYHRPHGALGGQTPYERLRQKAQDPLS